MPATITTLSAPGVPAVPAGDPAPYTLLGDQGQVVFPATLKDARIGLLDTTVLSLDGTWQMKVTRALPPDASDAAAYPDPGMTAAARELVRETVPSDGWTPVTLPRMVPFFRDHDGEAVFRREIRVPPGEAGKEMVLALGALDDFDDTFFNGVQVGHTDIKTPGWWGRRRATTRCPESG